MSYPALACRVPELCPADIAQLALDCMDAEPDKRPKVKEIILQIEGEAALSLAPDDCNITSPLSLVSPSGGKASFNPAIALQLPNEGRTFRRGPPAGGKTFSQIPVP